MGIFGEDVIRIGDWLSEHHIVNSVFFVTGATGLIGSIIAKAILQANDEENLNNDVVIFARNEVKARNMFYEFTDNVHMKLCVGDITQPINCRYKVDYVIHAASETKSINMMKYPVETLWTTVAGTKNILEFARTQNVKSIVCLSSMEAFGNPGQCDHKVKEHELGYIDIQSVRSCYSEGKRLMENLCACYANEYGVSSVCARMAQTFGAGVSKEETRVFAQFAKSAIDKKDIVLHTAGESYGNYVYTADAVIALFTLLLYGQSGDVYTVANEESTMKIREMAQMVAAEFTDNQIQVVFDIPEENRFGYAPDVKLRLDSTKMRQLGWKPQIGLKESYFRMMEAWKEQS